MLSAARTDLSLQQLAHQRQPSLQAAALLCDQLCLINCHPLAHPPQYVRDWVKKRTGFDSDFKVTFYPGRYAPEKCSILPVGDPTQYVPDHEVRGAAGERGAQAAAGQPGQRLLMATGCPTQCGRARIAGTGGCCSLAARPVAPASPSLPILSSRRTWQSWRSRST